MEPPPRLNLSRGLRSGWRRVECALDPRSALNLLEVFAQGYSLLRAVVLPVVFSKDGLDLLKAPIPVSCPGLGLRG